MSVDLYDSKMTVEINDAFLFNEVSTVVANINRSTGAFLVQTRNHEISLSIK